MRESDRDSTKWGRAFGLALGAMAAVLFSTGTANGLGPEPDPNATPAPRVGSVMLGHESNGPVLLIPVRYPLEASGRIASVSIRLTLPGRFSVHRRFRARLHAGPLRRGDRRKLFGFTHFLRIPAGLARQISRTPRLVRHRISLGYARPVSGDEVQWRFAVTGRGVGKAGAGACSTVPLILATAGRPAFSSIPDCGKPIGSWTLKRAPAKGKVRFSPNDGSFRYTPFGKSFGEDSFTMVAKRNRRVVTSHTFHVRVSPVPASQASVVAFGDSVTAGFGYFGATGKPMTIGQLPGCKPGATVLNDACSSNSYNRKSSVGTVDYLSDYGLSGNISWAAQWANQFGITNYKNLAVTGSAPTDWLPNGQFHSTLEQIETQDPDYILMTLGANPLLSDVLFNVDVMGCALESDLFGNFRQCVLDAFAAVDLDTNMNAVFTELVEKTTSRIVLMAYPLSIPSSALAYSAVQLEMMESLLNEVIANQAEEVSTSRIVVVTPPRFNVGIDMEPMYPSNFSCSFLGYKVDGPSVQSTPTQDELLVDHPLSFCSGPVIGPPWVISGDTGIHPSAAGYGQMASQIPAPGS